jgi:hypothetical protein
MEGQILYVLDIIYTILSSLSVPLLWTETLFFRILGLPTSTSFRMFPSGDIFPDYSTTIGHSYALISIMLIPYLVYLDRRRDGRGGFGELFRPLTREASRVREFAVMIVRVWLAAAWVNRAVAQFMTDYKLVSLAVKLSCVMFIL